MKNSLKENILRASFLVIIAPIVLSLSVFSVDYSLDEHSFYKTIFQIVIISFSFSILFYWGILVSDKNESEEVKRKYTRTILISISAFAIFLCYDFVTQYREGIPTTEVIFQRISLLSSDDIKVYSLIWFTFSFLPGGVGFLFGKTLAYFKKK